ncbi:alpha/beta hydrolase [Paenibacillus lutrae]|uniref:Prolyl oligopeptidase family serine peptidase n=1 Tax=Paenibacillus lutrae TaxID=2078573 RepID=A0A7X3FEY6_9BACL|nr:alpha/beta hydrolase-fold protein [Paenibacillus lutrae]MVO98394.1 prolyl oligopeptidase family serine peptidase [Paenibacillus lutrae]
MSEMNLEAGAIGRYAAVDVKQSVTMPRSQQITLFSRANNREYRIFIAVPESAPPAEGFPVIYLLDANSVFATMVEAVRLQSRAPDKTGAAAAVVVGIGYPADSPFHPFRHYDYTRSIAHEELPFKPPGGEWPEHGGAEAFMTFILEELKPLIGQKYSINTKRQTIFGHSLGGLFVLHMLYARPEAFQYYIAGSPSIHWNKRILEEEERIFAAALRQSPQPVRLYIGVGEMEKSHHTGMVKLAEQLCERLLKLSLHGVHCEYKEFEGEGHISVLPALISRAVRFALKAEP